MKTSFLSKIAMLCFGIFALTTSCKNPNATQETDGQSETGATPAEVDSSATDTSAVQTTTRESDLEGSEP
ncbi:MAG: hypothetical protein EOO50_14165 [Flavobacterium sp.]|uniref:hypothetical protein n=1 Tax=Flavobacterium sp. TaxID=239 RepID=UPI001225ABD4|nr:hypothetical protein [Flavobacterium sp.]RZJ65321.1 MAG: hypothetical protein EOO50_14165 [Flavobacterium sp.]